MAKEESPFDALPTHLFGSRSPISDLKTDLPNTGDVLEALRSIGIDLDQVSMADLDQAEYAVCEKLSTHAPWSDTDRDSMAVRFTGLPDQLGPADEFLWIVNSDAGMEVRRQTWLGSKPDRWKNKHTMAMD